MVVLSPLRNGESAVKVDEDQYMECENHKGTPYIRFGNPGVVLKSLGPKEIKPRQLRYAV